MPSLDCVQAAEEPKKRRTERIEVQQDGLGSLQVNASSRKRSE
jgi:hypothetical protein